MFSPLFQGEYEEPAGLFSFGFRYWFGLTDVNLYTQDREHGEIRRNTQAKTLAPTGKVYSHR